MKLFNELQDWYQRQCNGEWEHHWGVKIETLDNPGWLVTIDLLNTDLETKHFEIVKQNVPQEFIDQALRKIKPPFDAAEPTSEDWLLCLVIDKKFRGAGDPTKLEQIIKIFVDWKNVAI